MTQVYVFIMLLLFSLQLAVWVERIKTTRFHVCFVHEYNFCTFCVTEKAHTKHQEQTKMKLTIFVNKSSANKMYNFDLTYLDFLEISCIIAQQAS